MSEWKSIESAPKDGTRIILYDGYIDAAVSGYWHVEHTIDTPDAWEPGWEAWVTDDDIIVWDDSGPEYWMPFPELTEKI